MNKTFVTVVVLILVVAGLFFVLNKKSEAPTAENTEMNTENTSEEAPVSGNENSSPSVNVSTEITTGATKEFTITGNNFSFSPSNITVKKGDIVKITFKDVNGIHDFVIDEFKVATARLKSGEVESVSFTADKAGTFEFYCSVGDHRMLGMKGTLKVE